MESSSITYEFPESGKLNFRRRKLIFIFLSLAGVVLIISVSLFLINKLNFNNVNLPTNVNELTGEMLRLENREIYSDSEMTLGNKSDGISIVRKNVNEDCVQSPFDKAFFETLSQEQKMAVEQIRSKVLANLTHTFCSASSEFDLVRWLKMKNWDVDEAVKATLSTLEWRKEERVDELFTEDFSYFEDVFPIFMDGVDYAGRMVATTDVSSVDPRMVTVAGKGEQLVRYYIRFAEIALKYSREAQLKGQNVTQISMIVNAQGYNVKQHGCDQCFVFLSKFLAIVEEHYPQAFYKIIIINIPAEFEWLLHIAKAFLPFDTVEAIEIYGMNKKEWQEAVLNLVPADQIRPEFGGTKKTEDDF